MLGRLSFSAVAGNEGSLIMRQRLYRRRNADGLQHNVDLRRVVFHNGSASCGHCLTIERAANGCGNTYSPMRSSCVAGNTALWRLYLARLLRGARHCLCFCIVGHGCYLKAIHALVQLNKQHRGAQIQPWYARAMINPFRSVRIDGQDE